jgi:hypothetical protein
MVGATQVGITLIKQYRYQFPILVYLKSVYWLELLRYRHLSVPNTSLSQVCLLFGATQVGVTLIKQYQFPILVYVKSVYWLELRRYHTHQAVSVPNTILFQVCLMGRTNEVCRVDIDNKKTYYVKPANNIQNSKQWYATVKTSNLWGVFWHLNVRSVVLIQYR